LGFVASAEAKLQFESEEVNHESTPALIICKDAGAENDEDAKPPRRELQRRRARILRLVSRTRSGPTAWVEVSGRADAEAEPWRPCDGPLFMESKKNRRPVASCSCLILAV